MPQNTITELNEFGQSVWLDYISRSLITTGRLKEMIENGIRGMTSNPTIFDKAVSSADDYDEQIRDLSRRGRDAFGVYDEITVKDVQDAADLYHPVYEETGGLDGYVSLEIDPRMAYNTQDTVREGMRLAQKVNRPNVMFKVPSTKEGFPAIEELTASGLNINVTLIFSLRQYLDTAESYIRGIRRLIKEGRDPKKVRSVASIFVSRIDTAVDVKLDEMAGKPGDEDKKGRLLLFLLFV